MQEFHICYMENALLHGTDFSRLFVIHTELKQNNVLTVYES
jgi:hypothetical protein